MNRLFELGTKSGIIAWDSREKGIVQTVSAFNVQGRKGPLDLEYVADELLASENVNVVV